MSWEIFYLRPSHSQQQSTDSQHQTIPYRPLLPVRSVCRLVKRRRQQLSNYLKSRYPHPTGQAKPPDGVPAATAASGQATASTCLTMDQTLDRLLTASLNKAPELRYVRLSQDFWLPHVEVLLNSGVAERDPNRSDYVRLLDWQ